MLRVRVKDEEEFGCAVMFLFLGLWMVLGFGWAIVISTIVSMVGNLEITKTKEKDIDEPA
jgi:hypothetical protein